MLIVIVPFVGLIDGRAFGSFLIDFIFVVGVSGWGIILQVDA